MNSRKARKEVLNPRTTSAPLREIKASRTSREENTVSGLLGDKALELGTASQTKLCVREVKPPLFNFHPQLDEYLKTHLFGPHRDGEGERSDRRTGGGNRTARENGRVAIYCDRQHGRNELRPSADFSPIPVGEPNTANAQISRGEAISTS
ncbi:MAG: hypothetical protein IJR99_17265 [Kiritimatiellae bacterium]|nr:hypothetical protein [Kiritimatiellia bacterium]